MLKWLDSDANKAAEKYSHIHAVLIKIFYSAGLQNAEELADETIDRVADNVETLAESYEGEKIKYFRGVANFIKKENFRKKKNQPAELELQENEQYAEKSEDEELSGNEMNCLKKCLKKLDSKDRKMILEYYNIPNSVKKNIVHKKLAKKYFLELNALRVQVFRIKNKVSECVKKCAEKEI